jgi:multiple sugar transport system substrate-binding protein
MRCKRIAAVALTVLAALATTTSCTAHIGAGKAFHPLNTALPHKPETLTLWTWHSGPEAAQVQIVLDQMHKKYPWLTVHMVQGKTDADILQTIYSGKPPDVVAVAGPANVGKFCSAGAMPDLVKIGAQDGVDVKAQIPPQVLAPATFEGDTCMLPWLSDAYGLYYNRAMFAAAHISEPPHTLAELEADAKKLTTYNSDGSIKVAGFVPLSTFYQSEHMDQGPTFQAQWYNADGKSAVATDPKWLEGLTWQKDYVDSVGYGKLQKFAGDLGADSQYTTSNGFENGKVAMTMDGEWRRFIIAGDKSKVDYATAPFPTLDADDYGSGQIGGTMISYPKTAKDPAASWLVVKYLALDSGALSQLAQGQQNVPTTYATLKSSSYAKDPQNQTFINVLLNPKSAWKQPIAAGQVDLDQMAAFVQRLEAGQIGNIKAGLRDLAKRIDSQIAVN